MTNANGFNESILVGLEASFKTPVGDPLGYKLPVMNPSFKPTVHTTTTYPGSPRK